MSKNKKFRSAELNLFPAETAPGVNQKIYQIKLNLYQDFYLLKNINASISLEGNYYTSGLLSTDTIHNGPILNPNRFARNIYTLVDNNTYEVTTYDDAIEGSATVRAMLDNGEAKKSKLVPYLEGQFSQGSRDQSTGYPYWMIKNRLYGGAGLGWGFVIRNFRSKIEAGYFFDDYSNNFKRYSGNIDYQIFDYTALSTNFEFFSQSKYYSNSFQLGIKYNLKKKIKKE
jgi:hypothetical protein